ncbi:uncharacterized protein EAE98_002804 [Botrytis deweyae]|uniref:F-box domain-containing protein n=1 Tax=Botrytis deweyae TaxID=2478750 RepID=A0ABQ7IUS5_9HELO|nr:uncharacterized protein EAE98_002804 [Botrytis deweyae]KAF7934759.1 hypothetical protein EAE98_002804 [Botrytis deweyae]
MVRSTRKLIPPAELNAFALNAYPEDNLETAVQKYVIENWVKWAKFKMNGVRYMIAEDILYFRDKSLCITKFEGETNDRNRLFWNKLQYPVDPREIDRMSKVKEVAQKVLKHKSEDQWNVPRHSKTHFLNFPRDILDNIFKHALVALPGAVISPNLLATNWKKRYIEPSHKIHVTGQNVEPYYSDDGHRSWPYNPAYFENSHVSFKRKTLRDERGKYVELQRILRPQIDATLHRTCKVFHDIGSILLYRHNTFHFGMANESTEKSSPSWIGKWAYRPEPSKRGIDKDSISKAIQQLQGKAIVTSIPGWCYYDPFIRFLYHARMRNSTFIKNLQFEGTIKAHQCSRNNCRLQCDDDFITSMKCYIPFINTFCPGLHELTLVVDVDHWGAAPTPARRQVDFNEIFSHLLENGIRELKTVRVLRVVAAKPPRDHYPKADVSIARDTIQWFKEREIARVQE